MTRGGWLWTWVDASPQKSEKIVHGGSERAESDLFTFLRKGVKCDCLGVKKGNSYLFTFSHCPTVDGSDFAIGNIGFFVDSQFW